MNSIVDNYIITNNYYNMIIMPIPCEQHVSYQEKLHQPIQTSTVIGLRGGNKILTNQIQQQVFSPESSSPEFSDEEESGTKNNFKCNSILNTDLEETDENLLKTLSVLRKHFNNVLKLDTATQYFSIGENFSVARALKLQSSKSLRTLVKNTLVLNGVQPDDPNLDILLDLYIEGDFEVNHDMTVYISNKQMINFIFLFSLFDKTEAIGEVNVFKTNLFNTNFKPFSKEETVKQKIFGWKIAYLAWYIISCPSLSLSAVLCLRQLKSN